MHQRRENIVILRFLSRLNEIMQCVLREVLPIDDVSLGTSLMACRCVLPNERDEHDFYFSCNIDWTQPSKGHLLFIYDHDTSLNLNKSVCLLQIKHSLQLHIFCHIRNCVEVSRFLLDSRPSVETGPLRAIPQLLSYSYSQLYSQLFNQLVSDSVVSQSVFSQSVSK